MERITDNIYVSTSFIGCNPGYVVTSDGIVIIDTPMIPTDAVSMRDEIQRKGSVRFLINTENHVDHNFGNHFFTGLCPTICHEDGVEDIWAPVGGVDRYTYVENLVNENAPQALAWMPAKKASGINPPSISFKDKMTLRVGDQIFELIHTPGHTKGQLTVYIPKENVVFTGDNIFSGCQTWFFSSYPDAWLKSLEFIKTLDFKHLIPGHGPVCDKGYIPKQIACIREWVAAVASGIAEGWNKEKCVDKVRVIDHFPAEAGQEQLAASVRKANIERIFDVLQRKVEEYYPGI